MQALARNIAAEALRDDVRYDGSPFLSHVDSVALIVQDEIGLPPECVAAVYLHEATRVHRDIDLNAFPQDVRAMVDGLNKIATIKPKDTKLEAENYKKLIVQYSTDPRVTVLKIADRLEVMRHLEMFPGQSRERKILETLLLYIPLAHQLGLYNIKGEMENIYLGFAEPEQYRSITNKLKATEKDRERLMEEFIEPLKKDLDNEGIKYKLKIRTKSAYSIFKKMKTQKVPFEGVYDVFAMRFIIDCEPESEIEKDLCWKVYSYVTKEYEPDTKRLRDWITNPKPNGYESLHITVKNAKGACLEVQIRTKRMDDEAENGNAAHWSYKGIKHEQALDNWMKSVRYTLEHPFETKPEDLPQPPSTEIFVYTPTGELRILPAGATVLDFAFSIHSTLGAHCTGAKVNGKVVSIKDKLHTGDVVDIMSSKNQKPSQDWLNWVVSTKAKTRIKHELNEEEYKKAAEGRALFERRLKNWKMEMPDDMLYEYMKKLKYQTTNSFFAALGDQTLDINDVKAFIASYGVRTEEKVEKPDEAAPKKWTGQSSGSGDDILVLNARDVKGIDYKMAHCCNPVFGDDVFGFVTRDAGIKIHRMSCPNASRLLEKYPYRIQKVRWSQTTGSTDFQCELRVTTDIEHSVISQIMEVFNMFKASVRTFNVGQDPKGQHYQVTIKILVPSNMEVDKIISQISAIRFVEKVRRV